MEFPQFIEMIDAFSKSDTKLTLRRAIMTVDDYSTIKCDTCPIKTVKTANGNMIPWRPCCVKQPGPKILQQIASENQVLLGKDDITPGMIPATTSVDPGYVPCDRMLFVQNLPNGEGVVLCIDIEEPEGGLFQTEEDTNK